MQRIICVVAIVLFLFACQQNDKQHGFAIVIDKDSYQQAKAEVEAYASAIEAEGLKTFIIEDVWQHPDSIKTKLYELYNQKVAPIEGAVFIGDIPIAMIRDAQHMTSAFKMDQEKFQWDWSSIPSDRFYDDFDLEFEYLKKDTAWTLYHYYSLNANSPQTLKPEIYSGRIKPFESDHKYEDLKKYLQKVVRIKNEQNIIDQMVFFGGHGYNSESMIARMDEKVTLYDQFPWIKESGNLGYIDHGMEEHIKDRLISELQRDDLDLAILHHHGGEETEYLSGYQKVDAAHLQIEGVKRYLRSKLRYAKKRKRDLEETKKGYQERLGVPKNWFEGTFDPEVIKADSIFDADLDIDYTDVLKYSPNVRAIIFDACFNGSFHVNQYLSGAYIFNDGNTVVAQANSVNALQDKWPNEMIGLLGMGMRFGEWSKQICYLETHVIGDPTFKFTSDNSIPKTCTTQIHQQDINFWKEQLENCYPEIQSLALRKLYDLDYDKISDLLLNTYKNTPYGTVRMECFKLLSSLSNDQFVEVLQLAIDDNFEMIRRQATYMIGKSGDERLIRPLLEVAMRNNASRRVEFNVKQAIGLYEKEPLMSQFDAVFNETTSFNKSEEVKEQIITAIEKTAARWEEDRVAISDTSTTDKELKFAIRSLRNYNYHPGVETYCNFVKTSDDPSFQVMMLEALGWFNISHKKQLIIEMCKEVINDSKYEESVRNEATKTLNRLNSRWHR